MPSTSNFPIFARTPESRTYTHIVKCGGRTSVDGWILRAICNPYRHVSTTRCAKCGGDIGLHGVAWADTNEKISDYRKRLKDLIPAGKRNMISLLRMLCFFGGIAIGLAISYPFWSKRSIAPPFLGFLGGMLAGVAAAALFVKSPKIDFRNYR